MTATEDTPAATSPEDTGASPRHPLDPLTGAEIEAAASILKRDRNLAGSARFVYVTLREPAKETVLNHQLGQIPDREAHIVLRERAERKTYEATVSITAGEVRTDPGSAKSPTASSTFSPSLCRAFPGSRTKARTRPPRAVSARTTSDPASRVAPVTMIMSALPIVPISYE